MRRIICVLIVFIIHLVPSQASTRFGGNGLFYVNSAKTIPAGHLQFYTGTRYFGKVANFGEPNAAYTLWNVQGFATLNMGLSPHMEIAVTSIFYQDTNLGGGNVMDGQGNSPDDLFLSVKIGSFAAMESPFLYGGMISARIPTAATHNILYEPYSAGSMEVLLSGFMTYYSNLTFPNEGWSLHTNLSYLHHNDVGKELTEVETDATPSAHSSELLLGVGFLYPTGVFDFSGEINSRFFLQKPPETAYSREPVTYLTAGVYYKPYRWISLQMGFDLKLFDGKDETVYSPETSLSPPPENLPENYPSWRGVLGARLAILPTSLYAPAEKSQLQKKATDRKEILERMIKGQKDTEDAETEISRIRSERARVEEELKRLRKLLEEEKNNDDN